MKDDECIVLLDFAKNYNYIVQDAVQGFHWNNPQVTLHPFVANDKEQNHLNNISYCVLSDYLRNNARVVHLFCLSHAPEFEIFVTTRVKFSLF